MIEVIEIVVEVQVAPRKRFDGFCRCGRKWPVGTTVDTIRVIRDSWVAAQEEAFDKRKKAATSEDSKAEVEAERMRFRDEVKAALASGCVSQRAFDELIAEPMVAKHIVGKPRQSQFTPEIPESIRKPSIFDQFDVAAPAKGR